MPPTPPATGECAFPNVLVGGECCKESDYRAGTCGGAPPPLRAIVVPPPPPPGAQPEYCPSWFRMVGTSCCNLFTAGQCYPQTGGIACQPGHNSVGEGLSAQCCRQSAVKCTRRSANASCAAGEIPVERQGEDPACCREDPAGICTPPPTPTPESPTFEVTNPPSKCGIVTWIPIIGWVCEHWPFDSTSQCQKDAECPSGTVCRVGSCIQLAQPNMVPASAACQPPSTVVNGQCCTPEAVAAGACGVSPLTCTGGKKLVSNVCRCPAGTTENTKSGKCERAKPAAVQKPKPPVPTKPKEIVCQKGFHLEGGRCVADAKPQATPGFDFQIGIGIGGGGRRGGSPGGGAPKPPSPPPPN
jgi:hypothetical protein